MSQAWFDRWTRQFGEIPENMTIIDTETTGVDINTDLILELGYTRVRDGRIYEADSVVLDWTRCRFVDQEWLTRRLDSTRTKLVADGKSYHWNLKVLADGIDPLDAITHFHSIVEESVAAGTVIAGHNLVCFDLPLLKRHFKDYIHQCLEIPDNCLDSGAIEKGLQLSWYPEQAETTTGYARRVIRRPSKARWSLDRHCEPKYQLASKFGLDMAQAHRAGFDTKLCACLLSVFRDLSKKSVPAKEAT